jgi:hypothetical protein
VTWLDCRPLSGAAYPFCYSAEIHRELSQDDAIAYVTFSGQKPYDVTLVELHLGVAVHEWRAQGGGSRGVARRDYKMPAWRSRVDRPHPASRPSSPRTMAHTRSTALATARRRSTPTPPPDQRPHRTQPVYEYNDGATWLTPTTHGSQRGDVAFCAACAAPSKCGRCGS